MLQEYPQQSYTQTTTVKHWAPAARDMVKCVHLQIQDWAQYRMQTFSLCIVKGVPSTAVALVLCTSKRTSKNSSHDFCSLQTLLKRVGRLGNTQCSSACTQRPPPKPKLIHGFLMWTNILLFPMTSNVVFRPFFSCYPSALDQSWGHLLASQHFLIKRL